MPDDRERLKEIERAVPPPGPELDALVAKKVMGGQYLLSNPWQEWDDGPRERWGVVFKDGRTSIWGQNGDWSPSTDIAHAWEVAEGKIHDRFDFTLDLSRDGWTVRAWTPEDELVSVARSNTAPHAICLAALKAVG